MPIVKKGFVLIEAILAISLISASSLIRAKEESRVKEFEFADEFAADMSGVVAAIDKRIFLDGVKSQGGNWDRDWSDTSKVVNEMMGHELVGKDNPDCGNAANGWSPASPANSTMSLVGCNLFEAKKIPLGFDLSAKRIGAPATPDVISQWSINLFHKSESKFQEVSHLYPHIVRKLKLNLPLTMTGHVKVSTINRATGEEVTMPDCQAISSLCAISVKYESSISPLNSEDVYLRVDGSNAMRNSLRFSSGATIAQCYVQDTPTTQKKVPCGINFNPVSGELNAVSDQVYSSGLKLVASKDHAPVVVTCKDKDNNDVFCGVSTVTNAGGSLSTEAYLNSMVVNDFLAVTSPSGGTSFSVDDQGNVLTKGKVDITKELWVGKDATFGSDLGVAGNTSLDSDLGVTGNAYLNSKLGVVGDASFGSDLGVVGNAHLGSKLNVTGDTVLASKLNVTGESILEQDLVAKGNARIDKVLTVFEDASVKGNLFTTGTSVSNRSVSGTFKPTLSVSHGNSCSAYEIGELAMTSNGEITSCQSSGGTKRWLSAVSTSPIGTITIWPKGTPPSGWIECNGQSLNPYPLLKSLIGSRAPDLRGVFVRGWDHGRGLDSGRGLGSYQADQFKSHSHKQNLPFEGGGRENLPSLISTANHDEKWAPYGNTASAGGSETRPKNVAMMYIIKYQ